MIFLRRFPTAEDKAEATLQYPNTNYTVATDEVAIEASGATPPPHDYSLDYTTFKAVTDGTFKCNQDVYYSTDSGATWTYLASNTDSPTIPVGDKILWKNSMVRDRFGIFSSTGQFEVEGNILSLFHGDNFTGATDLGGGSYPYFQLFSGCTGMTSAKNFVLPLTNIDKSYAYANMFAGCTSLTTAPELPATSFKNYSYREMFQNCTSLTTAPELPATTLTVSCYQRMFQNCTSLNYVKCLATNINASSCLQNWVDGVAATGTFVKKQGATIPSGTSGIPSGWTVQEV